jgi:D-3-phosphoglycerate dehydrogenase
VSENLVLFGGPRERLKLAHEILTDDNFKFMTFDDFFFSCGDANKVIALWTELIPVVDSKLVNLFKNLEYVFTSTTGIDHIDLELINSRGLRLKTLRDLPNVLKEITSTSELTWCLVLAVWRNLLRNTLFTSGESIMNQREQFPTFQLSRRNLGIVGFGRIGKQVSEYGRSFGMHVRAYDPYIRNSEIESKGVLPISDLKDLLQASDVVILSATQISGDKPIIDENETKYLKQGSILINTARGGLWNESAIAEALITGKIGGVGVDVYQFEEMKNSRYAKCPLMNIEASKYNIVRTPHLGGASVDALEVVTVEMAKEISRVLNLPKND